MPRPRRLPPQYRMIVQQWLDGRAPGEIAASQHLRERHVRDVLNSAKRLCGLNSRDDGRGRTIAP